MPRHRCLRNPTAQSGLVCMFGSRCSRGEATGTVRRLWSGPSLLRVAGTRVSCSANQLQVLELNASARIWTLLQVHPVFMQMMTAHGRRSSMVPWAGAAAWRRALGGRRLAAGGGALWVVGSGGHKFAWMNLPQGHLNPQMIILTRE